MITLPQLTLVIGGAASGKSAWAEKLVSASLRPKTYIATAEAWDEEMKLKIASHRARRGAGWQTVEAPRDVVTPLREMEADRVVLLDCITLWLTNLILADADLITAETHLIRALTTCDAPVVAVTNEVGMGIVPDNALSRRFRAAQGRLNQSLAARAETVVTVIAGLPLVLKGEIPQGVK